MKNNFLKAKTIIVLCFAIFLFSNCNKNLKYKSGDIAPDFEIEHIDGKKYALHDLKGSIVLLDFWGSWCGPCRTKNPYVVSIYQKYKNAQFASADSFTVFSVALEASAKSWENAIKKDNITWKYNVCDLERMNSKIAKLYGINAIPTTYIINEDGIIIGVDLAPEDIEKLLDHQLKQ